MPQPDEQYPPNKPLGPSPKQGFGLNAAFQAPTPPVTNPLYAATTESRGGVSRPPAPNEGPPPTPTAAPTPSPAAQGVGAGFNINDLVQGARDVGLLQQTPEREAANSAQGYRALYGPTLSPPVSGDIAGFGVRQFDDQNKPYYAQPGVGVKPQPATSYGVPLERQY